MKQNKLLRLLYLVALWCATAGTFPAVAQVTVPNPWKNVRMLGGGFVSGIVYSPTRQDLLYGRTDVGGAYRWDAPSQAWNPLTDHLSRFEQDYTGVVSLATDSIIPQPGVPGYRPVHAVVGRHRGDPGLCRQGQPKGPTGRRSHPSGCFRRLPTGW